MARRRYNVEGDPFALGRRFKRRAKAKKRDYSDLRPPKAQPHKGDSWSIA